MRGHHDHETAMRDIAESVKNSAYEIIEKKKATYYGIAMSVRRICEAIILDQKSVLPVSHIQHGNFDIEGVSISMPAIVGRDGIEASVPIALSADEISALQGSANALKEVIGGLEL